MTVEVRIISYHLSTIIFIDDCPCFSWICVYYDSMNFGFIHIIPLFFQKVNRLFGERKIFLF